MQLEEIEPISCSVAVVCHVYEYALLTLMELTDWLIEGWWNVAGGAGMIDGVAVVDAGLGLGALVIFSLK